MPANGSTHAVNSKVDAYIDALDEHRAGLAAALRQLVWQAVPQADERFSFKIPFYHYFGMFCYLNHIPDGMELCFCRGKDLCIAFPQLEMGARVMIAGVKLYTMADIKRQEVPTLLLAAAEWQVQAWQEKKRFVKPAKRRKA